MPTSEPDYVPIHRPTAPPDPVESPAGADTSHDRRWWILGVLGIAQLMVILDSTIVNIALPSMRCTSPTRTASGW